MVVIILHWHSSCLNEGFHERWVHFHNSRKLHNSGVVMWGGGQRGQNSPGGTLPKGGIFGLQLKPKNFLLLLKSIKSLHSDENHHYVTFPLDYLTTNVTFPLDYQTTNVTFPLDHQTTNVKFPLDYQTTNVTFPLCNVSIRLPNHAKGSQIAYPLLKSSTALFQLSHPFAKCYTSPYYCNCLLLHVRRGHFIWDAPFWRSNFQFDMHYVC